MTNIDYPRLKQLVLILWDNEEDFNDEKTQKRMTPRLFKNDKAYRCYSKEEFINILNEFVPDQKYLFFIHLAHTKDNQGHYHFINSGMLMDFPNIHTYYITRSEISEVLRGGHSGLDDIFSWENFQTRIDKIFHPQTVSQMKERADKGSKSDDKTKSSKPLIKYAVFTALYEEFKAIDGLFDWEKDLEEKTETMTYRIGRIKGAEKYVVACFAEKSGMTEAAVICSEMINRFEPEYLLMPGVCGGSIKTEFGDVVVANKVFLLGKGKITDAKENIDGEVKNVTLHYQSKPIDLNQITDSSGKHIRVVAEVLQREIDSIELDEGLLQDLRPKLLHIQDKINEHRPGPNEKITVRLDPMACSLSVIDKEDYFEYHISGQERKTKGVEMESYGVARASKKANGGKTKFLIFKSVMDKTDLKTDDYKDLAAYTSAQFLKYLIEDNVI